MDLCFFFDGEGFFCCVVSCSWIVVFIGELCLGEMYFEELFGFFCEEFC